MGAKAMSSHGSGGALSRPGSACSLTFSEVDGVNLDYLLCAAAGKKTAEEVRRDIQRGCPWARMTLEDLLRRAADAAAGSRTAGACCWAQQQLGHHQSQPAIGRPVPRPLGVGAGPVLDALYPDGHEPEAGPKRGAAADGGAVVAERSSDRRKKRMIKNRESAARSRARKQANTNELENKIAWLEEENEQLRRHKATKPIVQYVPQLEPKYQLRRTNSANF